MRIFLIIISIFLALFSSCKTDGRSTSETAQEDKITDEKIKDGPYLEYHKSGEIKIVGEYKSGDRIGLWSSWYTSGELQSELNYKNGLEEGDYKVFHPNGILKVKGYYTNGKAIKEWLFFDTEGLETARKNYDA